MVPFLRVSSQFEAQLLAARLGCEGVVWELRGACSVYPLGNVEVLVDAGDLERAREMFLFDEVEAAFDAATGVGDGPDDDFVLGSGPEAWPGPSERGQRRHGALAFVAAISVLAAVALRIIAALL